MKIRCTTLVDITNTGVKNRFYERRMPFVDSTGKTIDTNIALHQARAQQCNWETVNQLISLRTLTSDISDPIEKDLVWRFEFEIADPASIATQKNPVGLLIEDCNGVPVLPTNKSAITTFKTGLNSNIWFDIIS